MHGSRDMCGSPSLRFGITYYLLLVDLSNMVTLEQSNVF